MRSSYGEKRKAFAGQPLPQSTENLLGGSWFESNRIAQPATRTIISEAELASTCFAVQVFS